MSENTVNQSSQPENRKARRNATIALAAALALLVLGALVACFVGANSLGQKPDYDPRAAQLQKANATYDEMVAELDEATSKSRLWISVASTMTADSSTGEVRAANAHGQAIAVLDNLSENSRDIAYSFALDDGTTIYQSRLIEPGQSIEAPILDACPSPGAYDVTVTAQGYDVESHSAVGGTVAAKATLNVE